MFRKRLNLGFFMLAGWMLVCAGTVKAQSVPCIVGSHVGYPDADGLTASRLVCSELKKRGVPVSEPTVAQNPTAPETGYRVELSRLGSLVFVRLAKVEEGKVIDSRETNVSRIEDVPDAAPRLADAMVHNTSVAETQRTDNLLSSETKDPNAVPARFMFGVGLGAAMLISKEVSSAYGVELNFQRQMPRWAMGLTGRMMGSSDGALFALNIGGRYFFTTENITPFAGASLGLYGIGSQSADPYGGAGAQLEFGVEAMRFTKRSRLGFVARVDFPFFTAKDYAYASNGVRASSSRYVLPAGLYAYYFF